MSITETKFTAVVTRNFKFARAAIHFTDNGSERKAVLSYNGIELIRWKGGDKNKWIASALCGFAAQLRTNQFNTQCNYEIFCCIGYTMGERNVGRYWHEYNNPNEIQAALATCRARANRMFTVPSNKLKAYNLDVHPGLKSHVESQHHIGQR